MREHLSSTQIDMMSLCGEAYRRRYIEGEKIAPGVAMLIGSGTHLGAEINFKQKIDSHKDLPASDIVDIAVSGFEDIVEEGVEFDETETKRGTSIVIAEAKDTVAALAGLHAAEQAPDYQPVAVEKEILIPMPGAPFDMLGYVDLIDNQRRVTDFKTAGKSKPKDEADKSTQLTVYAASFLIDTGELPAEVRLDTLVKTKTPKRQVLSSTRTNADVQALVHRVNAAINTIESGAFMPASPGSWKCSPKWCGYWSTCKFVNSERKAAASEE